MHASLAALYIYGRGILRVDVHVESGKVLYRRGQRMSAHRHCSVLGIAQSNLKPDWAEPAQANKLLSA